MTDNSPRAGSALLALIALAAILLPLAYVVISGVAADDASSEDLFLERPDPIHTACVEDAEWMRYHHWELLRRIRAEVVRFGQRGDVGLWKCMECHKSREQFCDRCHHATSLTPDCFGCHYYP